MADLIFSPDRKYLLTAAVDGEVRIWELDKVRPGGQPLHSLKSNQVSILAFAVSPDGKRFATAGRDDTVKLWDTAAGKELRSWQMRGPVKNIAFSGDGKYVASANADATIYLLEVP